MNQSLYGPRSAPTTYLRLELEVLRAVYYQGFPLYLWVYLSKNTHFRNNKRPLPNSCAIDNIGASSNDEDAIISKAGVDASPHRMLSNLIKSDMVKAFNTSKSAVNIMSVRRMPNSHFEANV